MHKSSVTNIAELFYMEISILSQKFRDHALYIRGLSPFTIRRYRRVLKIFMNQMHVSKLEEIDDALVKKFFYDGRIQNNWTPATFISYKNTLNVFFEYCIKEGYMKENFTTDIETPKLSKKLPPKLTKKEALRLLEVAYNYPYSYTYLRYRNHAIFAVFLFAGLRKQELLNLRLVDVDIENFTIFVYQGKGSKDRVVPMCYKLASILSRYLEERKRLGKTCPEFFTSLNRNMGLTNIGMRRLVEKIRVASGIKFSAHKLRHTFATLMLEGGVDIYSLSKMMGHASIKTTTIYLAASAEHLRKEITKHPLNDI
jgi:site-specific recombinase XerD